MRIVKKPWGHEEIWAETPNYLGKVLVIEPGHKLSRQYHNLKEETFLVASGILTLEIGADEERSIFILREGDSFHCPAKTIHRMINADILSVRIIEVSTYHPDDVVRLEDDYQR